MTEKRKDFFISYNGKDDSWAQWIAWQLEDAGYSVVIQAWDFRPGGNFVLEMQKAAETSERTLVVLSPNYLAALYTQPEWAAALVQDPTGKKRTLLPVRVAECELQGLWSAIIHIDLFGLEEAAARGELLAGIQPGRAKPQAPPNYPPVQGQAGRPPPRFPQFPLLVRKIRDRVHALLDQFLAKDLRDEIARQGGQESAAVALVPHLSDSPIEALDLMHHATRDCLRKLAEQRSDNIDATKEVARQVFGWLVLLAVDIDQVKVSKCAFDPWQGGIEITIPLESEAGTEVLVSSLGDRAAWFKLRYDNRNRPRVVGKDCFAVDGLEMGIGQTAPLIEIQRRIWVEVMKSEAPIAFGPTEQKQLKSKLAGRERRKESHYYITVPPESANSPLSDKALLKSLLQALPSLRVIYIGSQQGEGILLLDEYELWESIEAFLLMLRDTP